MWKKLNKRKEEKSVNFNPSDPNQVKRKLLKSILHGNCSRNTLKFPRKVVLNREASFYP